MSATITAAFINEYRANAIHLAQQSIARLLPHVMIEQSSAEAYNFDRVGVTNAVKKTARKVATPDNETPWTRRQSIPSTYHLGDVVEKSDRVQMLINPDNNFVRAQSQAMRRSQDDEIIEAAVGDSRDGGGNVVAFDTNQTLHDGSTAITFDLVTAVSERFMDNDIDPDEPKVFVISPRQARKLLQLTEATSGDYNTLKPLAGKGYVESWMGFEWIVSTRLLQGGAAGRKYNFAMTKRAIGMQMNNPIHVEIAKDPSISFATRVYCEGTYGAIRVEDEQLVRLDLSETI